MEEGLLKLFADYLDDEEELEREQKELLMLLGARAGRNIPFFYDCFRCMDGVTERAESENGRLSFYKKEECHLSLEGQELLLKEEKARGLLAKLIDFFEPVHPLGTVVELSEEFTKSLKLKNVQEKIKVIITERFVVTRDKQAYFPYVGSVYPTGTMGQGNYIHFTSALIDSVVQEGYRDEAEDAYILYMKKKVLLEQDAVSFGFLEQKQKARYAEEMGVKG